MMSAMQFEPFLQFAADFNMTASVLLTTTQIADIFLSSLRVAPGEVERGGLRFDDFWESLVRCAMVAYKDRKHVDPTNKLRALFLYMSVRIESLSRERSTRPEEQVHRPTPSTSWRGVSAFSF